ncbi:ImmA/IrrE family metallo-endopeptidase [Jeotgalibacillus salarius]|nr:ImmA/IrrE family metallo-endopeptidase [Jeotgalibacillus salarius]
MKRIFKPNFKKAENAAIELHSIAKTKELPVKVRKMDKFFDDLTIKKYSWYAKEWEMTLEEVIEYLGSDEGCCFYLKQFDSYLILYNENIDTNERIRWTIAHELGHYMLKHNTKSKRAILGRGGLSDEEYDMYEKEANCFARNLLAPPVAVTNLNVFSTDSLIHICKISLEAANNTYNFYDNGFRMGKTYNTTSKIGRQFSGFLNKVNNNKRCDNCEMNFSIKNSNYCVVCGSGNISHNYLIKGEDADMIYPGYATNGNHKPITCPRCENEEININGNYCSTCGFYLLNTCTNNLHDQSCTDDPMPTNIRFCPYCGAQSTYYYNGLLVNWEQIKFPERNKEDPFASNNTPIYISEDELPF